MVSNDSIKQITKEILKEAFFSYYSTVQSETKHLVLDRLFPRERRISSYMSGLQTSLGTGLWEKLAKKFAILNSFTIIENNELEKIEELPTELSQLINTTKTQRENNGGSLDTFRLSLNDIFNSSTNITFSSITKGKGADLILSKNNKVYIYDIKTVQVNANNGNSFNETIILWIAYYKYKSGINANNIIAKLIFPYNSSDDSDDNSWWSEFGSRVKPLTNSEVDVGNQFWSFITDNPNALSMIKLGIEELSQDNNFITLFQEVFNCTNNEELKQFSIKVKIKKVEWLRNISFIGDLNEITSLRTNFNWKHNESCDGIIKSRVNRLLDIEERFTCPICDIEI